MWIPVTFKSVMLGGDGVGHGGHMESEGISIWRRIGFKMIQVLFALQTVFISFRTLEYLKCGDAGFFGGQRSDDDEDVELNWDFVPIMLIATKSYLTYDAFGALIFDVGPALNAKIFNELIRLWGTTNQ